MYTTIIFINIVITNYNMPTAQIYLDEELDIKVRKMATFWNVSKAEAILRSIRLVDLSKLMGDEANGVQSG